MNKLQKAFIDEIYFGIKNELKHKTGEPLTYRIRNAIAMYSLANDFYYTSQKTLDHIKKLKLNISKRSIKGLKNKITYEHAIPTKVILEECLKQPNKKYITDILIKSDYVAILTHEEDKLLNDAGFKFKMPDGWNFGDDVYARYKKVGIRLLKKPIRMFGALKR